MARDVSDTTPLEGRDALVAWIADGEKPPEAWRVGTEHEKLPFRIKDGTPIPYEGGDGIRALLVGLGARTGWEPILEDGHPIGLADPVGGGAISLEPGGQFELSGAPLATLHETAGELDAHFAALRAVAEPLGIGFAGLGMSPLWTLAETPVMPKARYRIMASYMPTVGTAGLDMMFRTCTAQSNLDFSSEADMVAKLRVGLALQPLATALFANSPFLERKPNGLMTGRANVWLDVDPDRTGPLPFAFEDGMGYEAYVDYALDVPMYFVKRGETYHDVAGASFRDLMAGSLAQLPGERARVSDWANHLSTIFPDVRLKRYLEMRGADVGPPEWIVALSAFWTGLLYDAAALDGAGQLIKGWTARDVEGLRLLVPREGLRSSIHGRALREVAADALELARGGLARRARLDPQGRDETRWLEPIQKVVDSGFCLADELLVLYAGAWERDAAHALRTMAY